MATVLNDQHERDDDWQPEGPRLPMDALYEVVDGSVVELPSMGVLSNLIAGRIFITLVASADRAGLGTVMIENLFILDGEGTLRRRPDVAFVSAERWPMDRPLPEQGDWAVVPDLCVEVISPHDLYEEVIGKLHEYFMYGVRQVWIVSPSERQVAVYRSPRDVTVLTEEQTLSGNELFPDLALPLSEIFARLPHTGAAQS